MSWKWGVYVTICMLYFVCNHFTTTTVSSTYSLLIITTSATAFVFIADRYLRCFNNSSSSSSLSFSSVMQTLGHEFIRMGKFVSMYLSYSHPNYLVIRAYVGKFTKNLNTGLTGTQLKITVWTVVSLKKSHLSVDFDTNDAQSKHCVLYCICFEMNLSM